MEDQNNQNYTMPESSDTRDLSQLPASQQQTASVYQDTQDMSSRASGGSKMMSFVVKYSGGLIADEQQASYLMAIASFLVVVISIIVFFSSIHSSPSVKPSLDLILQTNQSHGDGISPQFQPMNTTNP